MKPAGEKQFIEEEKLYSDEMEDSGEITEPFDPKEVDISPRTMVISNIVARLKNNEIILDPDFQRNPNLWNDQRQSRLIESLIIRIPLPSFYFDYDEEDNYIVIDGLQRLWSIKRFMALDENDPGRLRLKGLEYLTEYNGKLFEELPPTIQRRIREETITAYVIRPGTPEAVRNSIFTRINTGGITLTPAEIKNSVYRGQAADLLKELAHSQSFKIATNHKVEPIRQLDCEFVNRFLAFYILGMDDYKDNLEVYLNKVLSKLKVATGKEMETYRSAFYQAMDTAHFLLGNKAFRKIKKNGQFGMINKPLFECVSVNLARLTQEQCRMLMERKERFFQKYLCLLRTDSFVDSITNATAQRVNINKRNTAMMNIISEVLEDASISAG